MAFIILAGAIALIAYAVLTKANRRKKLAHHIEALPNFVAAVRFDRPEKHFALLLDPASEQFALADPKAARAYGFQQLVAVEIERNGVSLERTNRGSQMVGAAVGGALLGPVGLLLGGLTGPKRREDKVKRLALRLYTNDLHSPFSEVVFFESKDGLKPDDKQVRNAVLQLEEWYGRFLTILRGQEQSVAAEAPMNNFGRRRNLLQGA